jgi:hypothetical protein
MAESIKLHVKQFDVVEGSQRVDAVGEPRHHAHECPIQGLDAL